VDEVDRLLDDLARWMGAERTDLAARARSRERWLRQQAVEEARFAGLALDLAEHGEAVSVRTIQGRNHHGRIVAVATDFVVVQRTAGDRMVTLIALAAIALLRPAHGRDHEPMGERTAAVDVTLAEALAGLVGDRPDVHLVVTGVDEVVAGQLRAVGDDVVTVLVPGDPPASVYVRLGSVTECSVLGSG